MHLFPGYWGAGSCGRELGGEVAEVVVVMLPAEGSSQGRLTKNAEERASERASEVAAKEEPRPTIPTYLVTEQPGKVDT